MKILTYEEIYSITEDQLFNKNSFYLLILDDGRIYKPVRISFNNKKIYALNRYLDSDYDYWKGKSSFKEFKEILFNNKGFIKLDSHLEIIKYLANVFNESTRQNIFYVPA